MRCGALRAWVCMRVRVRVRLRVRVRVRVGGEVERTRAAASRCACSSVACRGKPRHQQRSGPVGHCPGASHWMHGSPCQCPVTTSDRAHYRARGGYPGARSGRAKDPREEGRWREALRLAPPATKTRRSTCGADVGDGQLREAGHRHVGARVDHLELVVAPVEREAQGGGVTIRVRIGARVGVRVGVRGLG